MARWALALWFALLPLDAAAQPDYVRVAPDRLAAAARPDANADASANDGASRVLYLNRCTGGVTVLGGVDDSRTDQSSLIDDAVRLPPFAFSDQSWSDTLSRTRTILAPFDVFVTDEDPGLVDHDEVFVCGDPSLLGAGSDLGGLAPFTCSGPIRNAVAFVFADGVGDRPQILAETIAHEAAHAWGLDHSLQCDDVMSYLECGAKTYVDRAAACGESSERPCTCDRANQNSAAHLLALFGAGPGTPPSQNAGGCESASPDGGAWLPVLAMVWALAYRRRARGSR